MTSQLSKGNALETAVRVIEESILRASPALRENTFTIESKKIVAVAGVRHEIDLYVEVDMGKGYKAVFIFECKNWEDAVGKNEIIVFAEKIRALSAQKGFFVAKSLTKDALAQVALDDRMDILIASEHSAADTPVPFDFHFVLQERADAEFVANERNQSTSRKLEPLNLATATASPIYSPLYH